MSLKVNNFDRLFRTKDGWKAERSANSLRTGNLFAWRIEFVDNDIVTVYYILQQENLDLYLAVGTHDVDETVNSTVFHCVFLLNALFFDYKEMTYAQVYGDIDGDNKIECCYLTSGPTSGVHSVRFIAKRNGGVIYNTVIYAGVTLAIEDGRLCFVGKNKAGEDVILDTSVIDGNLIVHLGEIPYGD